jgi:hypothetical protein
LQVNREETERHRRMNHAVASAGCVQSEGG